MPAPLEQQGSLLNSDALQRALELLFSGAGGGTVPNLALLFQYSGYDEVIQPLVGDGGTDNSPVFNSFLNPTVGQIITAGNIRARIKYAGNYKLKSLIDIDPQVSMACDARGAIVIIPDANMPGIVPGTPGTGVRTGGGGPAAVFRIVRRAPAINKQAYEGKFGGFNIDATGINFVNIVSGFRIPVSDPSKNANDPDQNFLTNKKYTGCAFFDMDVVGMSGDQITIGATNGRTSYMNVRALNGAANGILDQNNDIVMFGHCAAGGNGSADVNGMGQGHGVQWGKAAGVFITTGNFWDSAAIRSTGCSAMFFNQRKMFSLMCSEFNGWMRLDGGTIGDPGGGYWRGGNVMGVVMAQFGACYVSDGVMIDTTFPSPDSRMQCNIGIQQYQSLAFIGMTHVRSDSVNPVATPFNAGGDLTGNFGTAPAYLYDVGANAMVNFIDTVCTAPNVRPWNGLQATFTVTIASPAVFTFGAAVVPVNGHRIVVTTTGALPTGLPASTILYVVLAVGQQCGLSLTYGGAPIVTTGSQSGTHTLCDFSTMPYNTHGGAQSNYILMDAYFNLIRMGGTGNNQHSHLAFGIAEIDDINPTYAIEIGDRTLPGGIPYRNALYGNWEFNNVPQLTDSAYDSRVMLNGQTRNIAVADAWELISIGGGGIATATINFPTDLNTSYEIILAFTGGPIAALTLGIIGGGAFNPNAVAPPTFTPGAMMMRAIYRHDTNQVEIISLTGGDRSNPLGRIDGTAIKAGLVGEIIQSQVLQGSAVAISVSGTPVNVTSVTLTPGNWRLTGVVKHRGSGVSATNVQAGISTTSATIALTKADQSGERQMSVTTFTGNYETITAGDTTVSITVNTQYFLVANATFSAGTAAAFGSLIAVRTQ